MHLKEKRESFSYKEEKIPAAAIFSLGTHFKERTAAREGTKFEERTTAFIVALYSLYSTVSVQLAQFSRQNVCTYIKRIQALICTVLEVRKVQSV